MADFDTYFRTHRDRHVAELIDLLRIPSVSSLSEHKADVRRAVEWAARQLRAVGMPRVEVLETDGHPAAYGEWLVDAAQPTVLIYGHVDVQPVDPEHLWDTPPFEPSLRDGRIYARGASDDKGCTFIPLKAVEALTALRGAPPVNLKFLLEGEEEIGSPHLPPLLRKERQRLRCDAVLSADGGFYQPGRPSLTLGSRGLCGLQIDVQGAASDRHSGTYGGAIQNPIHALAAILASMRHADGKVAVEGFYDQVREVSAEERAAIARVPFSEEEFLEDTGAPATFGEPGYSTLERRWIRPTLEVVGIHGGFQGEGVKTVLPAEAHAKITCRLVADQDPDRILAAIERHVQEHTPRGVRVTVSRFPGSARAYRVPPGHPVFQATARVLQEVYGEEPLSTWMGGTLPVAEMVESILETDFIFFSFGDPDSQIHAPNEFFRLESFDRGVRCYVKLLEALATSR